MALTEEAVGGLDLGEIEDAADGHIDVTVGDGLAQPREIPAPCAASPEVWTPNLSATSGPAAIELIRSAGTPRRERHLDLVLTARRVRGLDAVRGGLCQSVLESVAVVDRVDAERPEEFDVVRARGADDAGAEAERELGAMMPTPPEAPETKTVSPAVGAIARMPAMAVRPAI